MLESIINKTFNEWFVIKMLERHNGQIYYECRCSCGAIQKVLGSNLRNNKSKSCRKCQSQKHTIWYKEQRKRYEELEKRYNDEQRGLCRQCKTARLSE